VHHFISHSHKLLLFEFKSICLELPRDQGIIPLYMNNPRLSTKDYYIWSKLAIDSIINMKKTSYITCLQNIKRLVEITFEG